MTLIIKVYFGWYKLFFLLYVSLSLYDVVLLKSYSTFFLFYRFVLSSSILLGKEISTNPIFSEMHEHILTSCAEPSKFLAQVCDLPTTLQVTVLEVIEKGKSFGKRIVVAATHLYFHPLADNIRLLQTGMCLKYLEHMIEQVSKDSRATLVFCGDFNSTPEFGVVRLMTCGKVNEDDTDWSSCKSEENKAGMGPTVTHVTPLSHNRVCIYLQNEELVLAFMAHHGGISINHLWLEVRRMVATVEKLFLSNVSPKVADEDLEGHNAKEYPQGAQLSQYFTPGGVPRRQPSCTTSVILVSSLMPTLSTISDTSNHPPTFAPTASADFNATLNHEKDRSCGTERDQSVTATLKNLIREFDLLDSWRLLSHGESDNEDVAKSEGGSLITIGMNLSHPFSLSSAYGEVPFTNYTSGFVGCLDYIFYSTDALTVEQVVPLPSEEEVAQNIAIPSIVFPSDHLAIIADLRWNS
ncbi:hypothetical protein J437_LFUL018243 [Ladona fulva]|uniref:Endonuclease/exonuclease/phosphatase domain-containing protein n=1 Tax=Ladona fulva TaxID=123851 RepID=A0A8K0PAQ7_LADFU|nr:hypothetical protein J437_LFUL018243 [Ladona fulva]